MAPLSFLQLSHIQTSSEGAVRTSHSLGWWGENRRWLNRGRCPASHGHWLPALGVPIFKKDEAPKRSIKECSVLFSEHKDEPISRKMETSKNHWSRTLNRIVPLKKNPSCTKIQAERRTLHVIIGMCVDVRVRHEFQTHYTGRFIYLLNWNWNWFMNF